MFTGIIETIGTVQKIEHEGTNIHFTVASTISNQLKIDQSVAHNGVCLTVVAVNEGSHTVTAIEETLRRSNLGDATKGSWLNLERAMSAQARLDGHLVQGHVDAVGTCVGVEVLNGSWYYHFQYAPSLEHLLVDKGSVCINGVSLTVVNPQADIFSVAIIPYTFEHTNFKFLKPNDRINLEFDIIGKYIARYMQYYTQVLKS